MKARLLSAVGQKTRYAPRGASIETVELERVENQTIEVERDDSPLVRSLAFAPPLILDYPLRARTDEERHERNPPGRDISDPGPG